MTARRRRPGEGTIRVRANGTYEARYVDTEGRQRSIYRQTEDEVRRALTAAVAARDVGVAVGDDRRWTLGEYLEEWLETHVIDNPRKRPTTQRVYTSVVRVHLIPILGRVRMADLRDRHVRDLHRVMAANGSSPGTIKTAHSTLSAALAAWVRGNPFGRVNVALLVSPPSPDARTNRGEPIHLPTESDILAILERLREDADDLEPLYRLTIATGLRQGEALGLRWGDLTGLGFHLTGETPSLTIRRTIDPQTGIAGPTKSAAGTRTIRVSTALMTILGDHYRRLAARGEAVGDDDYVFPGKTPGAALKADALRAHLARVQAATGVDPFRWHDFRHYLVTKRLGRGDNPTAVSRSVGHARVATTVDMYDQTTSVDLDPMDEPDVPPTPILRVVDDRRGRVSG
jgi:integrase